MPKKKNKSKLEQSALSIDGISRISDSNMSISLEEEKSIINESLASFQSQPKKKPNKKPNKDNSSFNPSIEKSEVVQNKNLHPRELKEQKPMLKEEDEQVGLDDILSELDNFSDLNEDSVLQNELKRQKEWSELEEQKELFIDISKLGFSPEKSYSLNWSITESRKTCQLLFGDIVIQVVCNNCSLVLKIKLERRLENAEILPEAQKLFSLGTKCSFCETQSIDLAFINYSKDALVKAKHALLGHVFMKGAVLEELQMEQLRCLEANITFACECRRFETVPKRLDTHSLRKGLAVVTSCDYCGSLMLFRGGYADLRDQPLPQGSRLSILEDEDNFIEFDPNKTM
eukprot:TRINITY_DN17446_c0_g1_i1.p1 TRINITY_DN17446_c0_g1~~TRINITY_DN17446_c0_g1_i1.p1  ORF type:complete len:344 (+),score=72.59 TRINITY_DN17446_c0_g1_i1:173-1204(+)